MKKETSAPEKISQPNLESYQQLLEKLRVRLNLLNASVFLLEENLNSLNPETNNYLCKINEELNLIRDLVVSIPVNQFIQ